LLGLEQQAGRTADAIGLRAASAPSIAAAPLAPGLEPVDNVAARQGMGRIRSARAHARPGWSFRIHSENTRCATGVRRRGRPRFPVSKISRHSNCEPACAIRGTGRIRRGRDRATRRITDCRSRCHARPPAARLLRRSPGSESGSTPGLAHARPGFDPSHRERPVCGWCLLVVTTKRQG
jgi:hypothetical protein